MKALIVKFKKESFIQLSFKSASQTTPQQSHQQEYHKCTVCSASFSSINRLLSHNQMTTCGKSSCNHCEEIFDSKNKLHDHIRSHECAATSTSAAKSRTPHKTNLSTLAPIETSTPLPAYRSVSPPPPTYEPYKKPYLTVADLYMRYASLSKPTVTRTMIVLSVIFMQDLYEKFHGKEKLVISTNKPFKQHATRQNLGHAVFERFESIRCSKNAFKLHFSISSKSIAQGLIVQQQRHIKPIKHGALSDICINDVRRHTMSPVDLAVAVKTSTRFRTLTSQQRKSSTDSHQAISKTRRSDKV